MSPAGLQHLSAHRYKAGSSTTVDGVLNVWWEFAARLLPRWMAPNLVTLTGTVAIFASVVVARRAAAPCLIVGAAALPASLQGRLPLSLPPIVNWLIVAALFFYQTMDAIDGKQARRTNSSSPLGQLFDHGCDALVAAAVAHNLLLAIGLEGTWLAAAIGCVTLALFFAGQWEEYYTRVLRTNVGGAVGTSEAQLVLMAVHVAAALLPCDSWVGRMAAGYPTPLNHAVGYGLLALAAFPLMRYILNVTVVRREMGALYAFLPTAVLAVTTLAFTLPSAWTGVHLKLGLTEYRSLLLASAALAQTHLSTQMIVFSMARDTFPVFAQPVAWLLPLVAVVDAVAPTRAVAALHLYAGAVVAAYALFVSGAAQQIAAHLGIAIFTIPAHPASPGESAVTAALGATIGSAGAVPGPAAVKPARPSSRGRSKATTASTAKGNRAVVRGKAASRAPSLAKSKRRAQSTSISAAARRK